MAGDCFCGCGRRIPFGRRAASNTIGRRITEELAALRQAAAGTLPQSVDPGELERLLCAGGAALAQVRDRTHDDLPRDQLDRKASWAFLSEARTLRATLNRTLAQSGLAGAVLARASGKVVQISETGLTIRNDPEVRIRILVSPPDLAPFEVERELLVSRLAIPRRGDRVEVEYDVHNPNRFSFELAAQTSGLADELAQLARLHRDGALTDHEFQRAKDRLLDREPGLPPQRG